MTKMQQEEECASASWCITRALTSATKVNLHFPRTHHYFNSRNAYPRTGLVWKLKEPRIPGFTADTTPMWIIADFYMNEDEGTCMNQERLFLGGCQEIVGRRRHGRWKLRCASSVCQPDSNTAAGEERQLKTSSPINLADALLTQQAPPSYITFCHISRLLQIFTCLFAQRADPHTLTKYQAGSNILKVFLQLQIRRIRLFIKSFSLVSCNLL